MDEGLRKFLEARYPGLVEDILHPDKRLKFEVKAFIFDMQSTKDLPARWSKADVPALARRVRRDGDIQGVRIVGDIEEALMSLAVESVETSSQDYSQLIWF